MSVKKDVLRLIEGFSDEKGMRIVLVDMHDFDDYKLDRIDVHVMSDKDSVLRDVVFRFSVKDEDDVKRVKNVLEKVSEVISGLRGKHLPEYSIDVNNGRIRLYFSFPVEKKIVDEIKDRFSFVDIYVKGGVY